MVKSVVPNVKIHQDRSTQEHSGGIVWETSYILASYLLDKLNNRPSILELGAGCGLCGISLAATGKTADVVVTEQQVAMENLKRNVQLNPVKCLRAEILSWGQEDLTNFSTYDLIIGTDVIFKKELIEPLLSTMWRLFHETSEAYLLIQDREPEAVQRLEKRAVKYFEYFELVPIVLPDELLQKAAREMECKLYHFKKARSL